MAYPSGCADCGEAMEDRIITIALPRGDGGIALFRNVPAEVCSRCGEPRFSMHTTLRLVSVARDETPPAATIFVPVYDMNLIRESSLLAS